MALIKLDFTTRLNVSGMIRQRRGSDDEEGLATLNDVLKKIKLPQEVLDSISKFIPGQGYVDDPAALRAAQRGNHIEVELNKDELRKLLAVLKEWKNYNPEDLDWRDPLWVQIEKGIEAEKLSAMPTKKEALR